AHGGQPGPTRSQRRPSPRRGEAWLLVTAGGPPPCRGRREDTAGHSQAVQTDGVPAEAGVKGEEDVSSPPWGACTAYYISLSTITKMGHEPNLGGDGRTTALCRKEGVHIAFGFFTGYP